MTILGLSATAFGAGLLAAFAYMAGIPNLPVAANWSRRTKLLIGIVWSLLWGAFALTIAWNVAVVWDKGEKKIDETNAVTKRGADQIDSVLNQQ